MKANIEEEAIREFKKFKKVGETFNYLGIEMLVTGIEDNQISVDYVDKNGVLQSTKFSCHELPLLIKQNNEQVEAHEQGKGNEEKK